MARSHPRAASARVEPESFLDCLRYFLTPQLWKQVLARLRKGKASRWQAQPLILVLLVMTWCAGDSQPERFETARAFCRGYARWGRLTAAEVEALPWLMRLRDAVSAVWWLGRALDAGDARPGLERIAHLRTFTRWLGRHAGRLASVARLEVGEAW